MEDVERREKANKVERLALDMDYWLHSRSGDFKVLNFIRNDGKLGVTVYTESDDVEIYHIVDKSVIRMSTGKCSPFSNEGHFKKMEASMWKYVSIIIQNSK